MNSNQYCDVCESKMSYDSCLDKYYCTNPKCGEAFATFNPVTFDQGFDQIVSELRGIMLSKQYDYGRGNILAFGEKGILVRCVDKIERLKRLIWEAEEPKAEAVEDSWRDLANYAIIALMLKRGYFTLPLEKQ